MSEYNAHALKPEELVRALKAAGSRTISEETVAADIAAGRTPPPRPRYERLDTLGLGSHYNRMIHPLTRFPVKGVLWYQGCANSRDGAGYLPLYRALVNGWRQAWRQPELPFYSVQLAAFWNNWRRLL